MIVAFQTDMLRTVCEDDSVAITKLGAPTAALLRERLSDIRAAASIDELFVGNPRLSGEKMEFLTIDLGIDARFVWTVNHVNVPINDDGKVDWTRTSRIRLVKIEEV